MMYQWYAAYTNPRAERKVFEQLRKRDIEVFLPVHNVLKQYKNRKKKVEEVLFKSYIFVRITSKSYLEVLNIKGVVRFVSFEGKPFPVPENQIEIVKRIISNEVVFNVEDTVYSKGDKVEIIEGPLKGLKGDLVNIKGNYKVAMVLDNLHKTIFVDIDQRCLRSLIEQN